MERNRCVIIGSGLGGLACGVLLSRAGYHVDIYEQGAQPGGSLQCFYRDGAKFETGMHFIGSALPGETLYKYLTLLNLTDLPLSMLNSDGYDLISLKGDIFRFANGKENFIDTLSADFPKERDNLARYFDLATVVANASPLHSLRSDHHDNLSPTKYNHIAASEVLDSLINDQLLRNVLAGNLPLYAGRKGITPFSQHAFILDFYNRSAFRIQGGSDIIAKVLIEQIVANGGEVHTSGMVTRIYCDNTHVTSIEVNNSLNVECDQLIADIHPAKVLELVDSKLLRPAYRRRIESIRNTISPFSVYLKFKPDSVAYLNANFYSYNIDSPWEFETRIKSDWGGNYMYMHFCNQHNQKYAQSGELITYMDYSEVAKWKGTSVGRRGSEYENFKRDRAERLIARASDDFPGLRDNIESYYTSTPLTHEDYTGNPCGSLYGRQKDVTLGVAGEVSHLTRIPNLLLTGQNVNSHGMLGVLVGSILTCSALIPVTEMTK